MASRRRQPDPESARASAERGDRAGSDQSSPFRLRSSTFAGYRVERIISTGSMGSVVTARHHSRAELVVVKLLHPQLCDDPVSMSRISHEAHVLARVASEYVVRLLDAGWTALVGPYVVLEYLDGMDLARMLEQRGPLPAPLAVEYLLQACEALAVAHAAGITHRDIKPENLFAVAGGSAPQLKLLDFGIAQHGPESFPYRDVATANDAGGPLLGTPAYMAPERILDLPNTDQRSDIWSLGVVLHELLTGRSLFAREDVAETCARVVNHRFELEGDRSRLPLSLRGVIARCLARRLVDRFQSVRELAEALRKASVTPERSRGYLTGKYHRQAALSAVAAPAVTPAVTPAMSSPAQRPRSAATAAASPARPRAANPSAPRSAARGQRARWLLWSWLATALIALAGLAWFQMPGR
jgi:eukaryotic-like serine/threonine-protein kinase